MAIAAKSFSCYSVPRRQNTTVPDDGPRVSHVVGSDFYRCAWNNLAFASLRYVTSTRSSIMAKKPVFIMRWRNETILLPDIATDSSSLLINVTPISFVVSLKPKISLNFVFSFATNVLLFFFFLLCRNYLNVFVNREFVEGWSKSVLMMTKVINAASFKFFSISLSERSDNNNVKPVNFSKTSRSIDSQEFDRRNLTLKLVSNFDSSHFAFT